MDPNEDRPSPSNELRTFQERRQRPQPGRRQGPRTSPTTARPIPARPVPVPASKVDWRKEHKVCIELSEIPQGVNAGLLHLHFADYGEIESISIFKDWHGGLQRGKIWFCPPPKETFKEGTQHLGLSTTTGGILLCQAKVCNTQPFRFYPSLNDPMVKYPERMILESSSIEFGSLTTPNTLRGQYKVVERWGTPVFSLNMEHREIIFSFKTQIPYKATIEVPNPIIHEYVFELSLTQPMDMTYITTMTQAKLILVVGTSPKVYRKYGSNNFRDSDMDRWNSRSSMVRQTSIMPDVNTLYKEPVDFKQASAEINIAHWKTYVFTFDKSKVDGKAFRQVCDALCDTNIDLKRLDNFKTVISRSPPVWQLIDAPESNKPSTFLKDLTETPPLEFSVRYQLEVCISHGLLNEYELGKAFVEMLRAIGHETARKLLELVAIEGKPIQNPMEIFEMDATKRASKEEVPRHSIVIRTVTITPTTMIIDTPAVELSNRVLRKYSENADRFLRVRFLDEKNLGRIYGGKANMDPIYDRVKRALTNGIKIGDRVYEYLASGNSQFRDSGAYFFCPVAHLKTEEIRTWMGDFGHIKVVAKYAARLGQCFSTTRPVTSVRADLIYIPDVYVHDDPAKSCFTDGVGMISNFMAQIVSSDLSLKYDVGRFPSVFQFRLGGFKGVLAATSEVRLREIHMRASQSKFPSTSSGLEIIRHSQFGVACLNRQIITILSSLGVPTRTFCRKAEEQVTKMNEAMNNQNVALTVLQRDIDYNQMTVTMAGMILDGFMTANEPFMMALLKLWRAWSIKGLKEKAKIVISNGGMLLGCTDETRTLKGHFDHLKQFRGSPKERLRSLPEVFVRLSKGENGGPEVILGPMILARNPSLHPGDVRVVRGVDVPALKHLEDVVVLPQTGDEALSTMCSGGDLDGDDYLVIWDKDILPKIWNHEPMNYAALQPKVVERVTMAHVVDFFVDYMRNNSLGSIANAHLANADIEKEGPMNYKCLELAALHSKAVDFAKTGQPAIMTAELHPKKWPHFMEKDPKKSYHSRKVLGQLYDMVDVVEFKPDLELSFDDRVLNACVPSESHLSDASRIKALYDQAMHRIMSQHDIKTEFEVWSTFIMHHAKLSNDYKFHEEIGNISSALKDRFKIDCIKAAGGKSFAKLAPFVVAMYKVTQEELSQARVENQRLETQDIEGEPKAKQKGTENRPIPFISFPWLFHTELGKIANDGIQDDNRATVSTISTIPADEVPKDGHPGMALNLPPAKEEVSNGKFKAVLRETQSNEAVDGAVASSPSDSSDGVHGVRLPVDDSPDSPSDSSDGVYGVSLKVTEVDDVEEEVEENEDDSKNPMKALLKMIGEI